MFEVLKSGDEAINEAFARSLGFNRAYCDGLVVITRVVYCL